MYDEASAPDITEGTKGSPTAGAGATSGQPNAVATKVLIKVMYVARSVLYGPNQRMTPSEAPKAFQASEPSELLIPWETASPLSGPEAKYGLLSPTAR